MKRLGSLFSGYGGLDLAAEATFGAATVWHCDPDPAAGAVLARHWPHAPNLGDIEHVDWAAVEPVDVLTGGFPCQDLSLAGRRAGLAAGTRSGLWAAMARAIDALRPEMVVIENVRGILSAPAATRALEPCAWCVGDRPDRALRALGAVLGDLADRGYDASWCGLRAADVGAPHGRYRVFVVAQDTDRAAGVQRWQPAPGHAPGGWARGDAGRRDRAPAAYSDGQHERRLPGGDRGRQPETPPGDRGRAAAHTARERRHQGRAEPSGLGRGPDPALGGDPAAGQQWGQYAPAIDRWRSLLGRPAPDPTEPGTRGGGRLTARFVEWLMGLPAGWVTDVLGLTRNDQLRLLGNGVVPQQATEALHQLAHPNHQAEQDAA